MSKYQTYERRAELIAVVLAFMLSYNVFIYKRHRWPSVSKVRWRNSEHIFMECPFILGNCLPVRRWRRQQDSSGRYLAMYKQCKPKASLAQTLVIADDSARSQSVYESELLVDEPKQARTRNQYVLSLRLLLFWEWGDYKVDSNREFGTITYREK